MRRATDTPVFAAGYPGLSGILEEAVHQKESSDPGFETGHIETGGDSFRDASYLLAPMPFSLLALMRQQTGVDSSIARSSRRRLHCAQEDPYPISPLSPVAIGVAQLEPACCWTGLDALRQ